MMPGAFVFWQQGPEKLSRWAGHGLGPLPPIRRPYRIMMRPGAVQFGKIMEKDRIWRHKPHILRTSVPPGARLCYTIPTNSLGGNSYAVD